MNAQHTPGPWQVNDADPTQVCDADGEVRGCAPIATTHGRTVAERKANAARIVQCVNAHEDLVAALTAVNRHNAFAASKFPVTLMEQVRAAIAKATGGAS